jgi:hypothetical protein
MMIFSILISDFYHIILFKTLTISILSIYTIPGPYCFEGRFSPVDGHIRKARRL